MIISEKIPKTNEKKERDNHRIEYVILAKSPKIIERICVSNMQANVEYKRFEMSSAAFRNPSLFDLFLIVAALPITRFICVR
jgi:hypothetical protein